MSSLASDDCIMDFECRLVQLLLRAVGYTAGESGRQDEISCTHEKSMNVSSLYVVFPHLSLKNGRFGHFGNMKKIRENGFFKSAK